MIRHSTSRAIHPSYRCISQQGGHKVLKPSSRILLRTSSPGLTSGCDYKSNLTLFTSLQSVVKKRFFSAKIGTDKDDKITSLLSNLSPRLEAKLEERLLDALRTVIDPVLKVNIRKLGWISSIQFPSTRTMSSTTEKSAVTIFLSLPLLHPHKEEIEEKVRFCVQEEVLSALKEESTFEYDLDSKTVSVHVNFLEGSKPTPLGVETDEDELLKKLGPGLKNVGHFLAVYSCKGGVGKSTLAANLAYELARMGGRIGLIDVDVYGPSLPIIIKPNDPAVHKSPLGKGMVMPIEHEGLKMLSLGFVSPSSGVPGSGTDGGAAVMRGPMASRVVTQLLKGTDWGSLDVLILDMPPGTGDIQLTICQDLELSGAISVTTPSRLAVEDAKKGIEMFTSLGVPTLAMVENMSYFDCDGGSRHFPFGKSIQESFDMDIFQFPISNYVNDGNDTGTPLCLSRPREAATELDIFNKLATDVASKLLKLQFEREGTHVGNETKCLIDLDGDVFDAASIQVSANNSKQEFVVRFFSESHAIEKSLSGDKLRLWHPKLGTPLADDNVDNVVVTKSSSSSHGCSSSSHSSSPTLFPCTLEKKGRYGYSIEWADGATVIYSMSSLAASVGGKIVSK